MSDHALDEPCSHEDRGFTLVELLIVITLLGMVTTVLSTAMIVILRTVPSTELRIDDARSTRGLATWLSHDVVSAPPFRPGTSSGSYQGDIDDSATRNDCGVPGTRNLLHLSWVEQTATSANTYVANYRVADTGPDATIRRFSCSKTGSSGSFGPYSTVALTTGLSDVALPTATLSPPTGDVELVRLELTADDGSTTVLIDVASRNPADFFP